MSTNGKRLKLAGYWVEQLDKPVLWAAKGNFFINEHGLAIRLKEDEAFDCSGLVTCGLLRIGAPDSRGIWSAQHLSEAFPTTTAPSTGDLAFYGPSWAEVTHVAGCLAGGHVVSADGATSRIRTLEAAKKAGARVRVHQLPSFRSDFLGFRINTFTEEKP